MIAVDTNILLYAHRGESSDHAQALAAVRRLAGGATPWAIPVFVLGEFLRVATHPRVYSPPSTTAEALAVIDALLASPTVRLLAPGDRFWAILREVIADAKARGNLVFDAQIVAACREHGVTSLLTEDRDFGRFASISAVRLGELS